MTEKELQLLTALEAGVVNVTFTKADGTVRKMRCTRNQNLFVTTEAKTDRKPNQDVAVVFDLDINATRSFRLDSVISFKGE